PKLLPVSRMKAYLTMDVRRSSPFRRNAGRPERRDHDRGAANDPCGRECLCKPQRRDPVEPRPPRGEQCGRAAGRERRAERELPPQERRPSDKREVARLMKERGTVICPTGAEARRANGSSAVGACGSRARLAQW